MATTVSFNGASYQIPVTGDRNYGAYTSAFLNAVAAGAPGKAIANTFSVLQTFSAGVALAPQAVPAQTTSGQAYGLTGTGDIYLLARTGYSTTPYKLTQAWLQPVAAKAVVIGPTSGADAYATARLLVAGDIPDLAQSQVTSLVSDLAAKATDSLVVHLAGIETIAGAKTFSVAPTFTLGATYAAGAGLTWTGRSVASSPADGIVLLTNNAATAFTRLQLGGTTASFPSIKRNSTALNFRLADDSADADITAGALALSGSATLAAASAYIWSARAQVTSPADGIVLLRNNAGSDFTRLQLGGTTSSFPSLKRSATAVAFRLADDSADAPITASQGTFSALLSMGTVAIFTAASSTNSAPALAFSNTSNTGFFAPVSGTSLGVTVAGTTAVTWTGTLATYAATLSLPAGSFTTPSVTFGTNGTGIYGGGAVINFAAGSAIQFQMSATQFTATPTGSNSAPLYCFAASSSTGLYGVSGAGGSVSTSINGTERARIGPATSGNPIQTLFGAANGSTLVHQVTSTGPTTVTAASTTVAVIPAGSLVLAVTARVTTTISGGSVTSWQLGDAGVGTTQYGTGLALTSGTTTGIANTTLTSPKFYAANTNITFTPVGGTPAAGAVRVDVYYIQATAPTS